MKKFRVVLAKFNVSKSVCDHLIGQEHSTTHRYVTGVVIMAIGVGVTKVAYVVDFGFVHGLADLVGYGIHGIGAIPFVEHLTRKV